MIEKFIERFLSKFFWKIEGLEYQKNVLIGNEIFEKSVNRKIRIKVYFLMRDQLNFPISRLLWHAGTTLSLFYSRTHRGNKEKTY